MRRRALLFGSASAAALVGSAARAQWFRSDTVKGQESFFESQTAPPSLDLNFASRSPLDPRIAFTRASGSTYFDATGTMQTAANNAPRIDYGPTPGGVTNWIYPSTNWFSSRPTTASQDGITQNAGLAPDGQNTAMLFTPGTSSGVHQWYRFINAGNTNTVYTHSVYAKAAGYNFLFLSLEGSAFNTRTAIFNLSNGTTYSSDAGGNAAITSVGNGWYRCSVTATSYATGGSFVVNHRIADTGLDASGAVNWTGDGASGGLVWGQQVEQASSAGVYVPTTSAPANSGATPLGLLIEEQRTNSIRNARGEGAVTGAVIGGGTVATNWTMVNQASGLTLNVAPITANGMTGVRLTYTGTTSATPGVETLEFEGRSSITAAAAQVWSGCYYFRLASGTLPAGVTLNTRLISFTSAAAVVDNQSLLAGTPTGTLRRGAAKTLTLGTGAAFITAGCNMIGWPASTAASFAIDIVSPQLELGAFATSLILPAVGTPAATTRAVDSAYMTGNFPMPGTISIEASHPGIGRVFGGICGSNGFTNSIYFSDGNPTISPILVGGASPNGIFATVGTNVKVGMAIGSTSASFSVNGAAPTTGTPAVGAPPYTTLSFGSSPWARDNWLNGYIRRVRYWPRQLSGSELQVATT